MEINSLRILPRFRAQSLQNHQTRIELKPEESVGKYVRRKLFRFRMTCEKHDSRAANQACRHIAIERQRPQS